MTVSTEDLKRLREESGAGIMDCKHALEDANGDFARAKHLLAERGVAKAAKRAERVAAQGIVECYVHHDKRVGALVELNCETDFVARTEEFQKLARELAMQVASTRPKYVSADEIQPSDDGSPDDLALLEQPYIRDGRPVKQLVTEAIARTGENVRVRRFTVFVLGQ